MSKDTDPIDNDGSTENVKKFQFPRGKEIRQIKDLEILLDLIDQVSENVAFIQVRLEFPPKREDGSIDPEWDARARAAYAFGLDSLAHLERRERFLTKVVPEAELEAKQLKIDNLKNALAQVEASIGKEKIKLEREKIKLIGAISWSLCLASVVRKSVGEDEWERLRQAADLEQSRRIDTEVNNQPVNGQSP